MPPMSAESCKSTRIAAEGCEQPSAHISPSNSARQTEDVESLKTKIQELERELERSRNSSCPACGYSQKSTALKNQTPQDRHRTTSKHKAGNCSQGVRPSNQSDYSNRPLPGKQNALKPLLPTNSIGSSTGSSMSEVTNVIKEQTNQIKSLKSLVQKQSELIHSVLKQKIPTRTTSNQSQAIPETPKGSIDLDNALNPETLISLWNANLGLTSPQAPHSAPTISTRRIEVPTSPRKAVPNSSSNLRTCPFCLKCFKTTGETDYRQHVTKCAQQKEDNNNSIDSIKCSSTTDDRLRALRTPEQCPYCSEQFTCEDSDNEKFTRHLQRHEQTFPSNDFVLL